jgi:hypothetical protein
MKFKAIAKLFNETTTIHLLTLHITIILIRTIYMALNISDITFINIIYNRFYLFSNYFT